VSEVNCQDTYETPPPQQHSRDEEPTSCDVNRRD
jgi:hypothetical protein